MFWMVRNKGEVAIESLTVLGLSSSRGRSDAIGQFGSGSKHGVLTCLRMGINPTIYTGNTKVQFYSEPARVGGDGQAYNRVLVKVGNKSPKELSMALEYGALDWTELDMGLREFVSNAIDACGGDASQVECHIVDTVRAKAGYTTVALPLTPEVQRFHIDIPNRFLQFSKGTMIESCILDKSKPGNAYVYRKGVMVRIVSGSLPSIFDYNFGDEVKIDEARNMDDYQCKARAADMVSKDENSLVAIFKSLARGEPTWEKEFGDIWDVKYNAKCHKQAWQDAFASAFGTNAIVCLGDFPGVAEACVKKGLTPIALNHSGWYAACADAGIQTAFDAMCATKDGKAILPPTEEAIATLDTVWEWLETLNLTANKPKPEIKCFQEIMQGGGSTCGFYKDGVVYLHLEHTGNVQTCLEECGHYATSAGDCCRDLQDWAFRVAASLMTM